MITLERQTEGLSSLYQELYAQRTDIENQVVRMRPASLDPDLLEERARLVLGYSLQNEQILFFNSQ